MSPVIFWFRNDLRLHNQPALHAALAQGSRHLLPVLCLPDAASPTPWGFARIGPHRRARLVSAIQRDLETQGDAEVGTGEIGARVMTALKALDSVAYIRFASVYKDFGKASDFEDFAASIREVGGE